MAYGGTSLTAENLGTTRTDILFFAQFGDKSLNSIATRARATLDLCTVSDSGAGRVAWTSDISR